MSLMYGFSSSNRTSMPFKDLQGMLNEQIYTISDLSTGICLCLRILSYNETILSYSVLIDLARVG